MPGQVRNFLTVDVEEWFHIGGVGGPLAQDCWDSLPSRVDLTTRLTLDLLARRAVTGTFFILGWIADRYPHLVDLIRLAGHEIASHGWSHRRVYELDETSFDHELTRASDAITAAGAPPPVGFRAPEWSINDRSLWALGVLARRGFLYDSSMTPLRILGNPDYPQVPHRRDTSHGSLLEVPPLVARRFGQQIPLGGGWGLRMSSPAAVAKEIDARNRRGEPVTLFLHPWEIDPAPPRVALPWTLAFSHYWRLTGYRERFDEVLASAPFGPIGDGIVRGDAA